MLRFRFWKPLLFTEERNMRVLPHYRTDLTLKQWEMIQKPIPQQKKGRNKFAANVFINAILYVVRMYPKPSWLYPGLSSHSSIVNLAGFPQFITGRILRHE